MNIAEPTHILCHLKANGHQQNQVGFIHWEPVIVYGARRGRRSTNVLRAPILYEPSAEPHPCPKPVALAEQAIRLLAPEGALVLDPFLGSGTTGVAAINTGRHFIGIENHAPYAEIARRRLTDAAAQPRLELTA